MVSKRAVLALVVAQWVAGIAVAQEAEFGRVSGGQIELLAKGASKVSGTLGLSISDSAGKPGYEGTLGGTILEDRLWFFAAATVLPQMQLSRGAGVEAFDAKMTGQIGDRNTLAASFSQVRGDAVTPLMTSGSMESSFLSLRYTGIASQNLFFTASFLRRAGTQPVSAFTPYQQ